MAPFYMGVNFFQELSFGQWVNVLSEKFIKENCTLDGFF